MRSALRQLPVFIAIYAMLVFAFGAQITQALINANSGPVTGPGIWVQLCASGQKVFMPLPEGSEVPAGDDGDGPAPTNSGQKACHACNDRRATDGTDDDDLLV